jgi:hypothetical protein
MDERDCLRVVSGIIDNATAVADQPLRYRYALLGEGLAAETEPL